MLQDRDAPQPLHVGEVGEVEEEGVGGEAHEERVCEDREGGEHVHDRLPGADVRRAHVPRPLRLREQRERLRAQLHEIAHEGDDGHDGKDAREERDPAKLVDKYCVEARHALQALRVATTALVRNAAANSNPVAVRRRNCDKITKSQSNNKKRPLILSRMQRERALRVCEGRMAARVASQAAITREGNLEVELVFHRIRKDLLLDLLLERLAVHKAHVC